MDDWGQSQGGYAGYSSYLSYASDTEAREREEVDAYDAAMPHASASELADALRQSSSGYVRCDGIDQHALDRRPDSGARVDGRVEDTRPNARAAAPVDLSKDPRYKDESVEEFRARIMAIIRMQARIRAEEEAAKQAAKQAQPPARVEPPKPEQIGFWARLRASF